MSNLYTEIREAIDTFDIDHARQLLHTALQNPDAEIYFLAARVAIDDEQRRHFLQKTLELDPHHDAAQAALNMIAQHSSVEATSELATTGVFVMTTLRRASPLYEIPHSAATSKANLAEGLTVFPVRRGPLSQWFNVLFEDTDGNDILGWLPREVLSDFNLDGAFVPSDHLPVTSYEFSTKDELGQLRRRGGIHSISKSFYRSIELYCWLAMSIFGMVLIIASVKPANDGNTAAAFGLFATGFGLIIFALQMLNKLRLPFLFEVRKIKQLHAVYADPVYTDYPEKARQVMAELAADIQPHLSNKN